MAPAIFAAICRCLIPDRLIASHRAAQPPIPPRVLLVGPSGSGKTSFLFRLKTGAIFDVSPTVGCNVEEIPVTSKTSLIFSDIGGSSRRDIRLHFLHSVPILDLSLLFFIDVSTGPDALAVALEDLVYAVSYAHSRTGGLRYVGVVLNQQDKLAAASETRYDTVQRIKQDAVDALEGVRHRIKNAAAAGSEEDALMGTEAPTEEIVGRRGRDAVQWRVLDGGDHGISVKTGKGVREVFEGVCKAVFGVAKPIRMHAMTGSPVNY